MSVFKMNNLVRSCLICSTFRLRNYKNRISTIPLVNFVPKRYESKIQGTSDQADVNLSEDFDFEAESPYSNIDFEAVSGGDAEKLKTLKILQLEVDLLRQQGEKVPARLSTERWKDLLSLSPSERPRYLQHLWLIDVKSRHAKEKARQKSESYLEFKANKNLAPPKSYATNSPLVYNLTETCLFHRIYDSTMIRFLNYKLLQAEWFGPKLIVDCSYEPFMNLRNTSNCVKQMVLMWSENRDHCNPYDLIFSNVNPKGVLWQKFTLRVPRINDDVSPVHFTTDHYLNLFPKERLVYLTPHCPETLEEFDPDDIYIIGAYVDLGSAQPISLAKAKKEGLRMAKLPLDKYLRWAVGHKCLTLNQMICIMNDIKEGQSWTEAFRHVPRRKLSSSNTRQLEDREDNHDPSPLTAKAIRDNYRKNFIYDLLLKNRSDSNKS